MPSIYSLTGFSFFETAAGPAGPSEATLEIAGSDDLGFTHVLDEDSDDVGVGTIEATSGELFGLSLNGSVVDSDFLESSIAQVELDGNSTQVLVLANPASDEVFVFPLAGDTIGEDGVPSQDLLEDYDQNSTESVISSGPFAPGTEFSPADAANAEVDTTPFEGTSGDDELDGFPTDDLLEGLEGNDTLNGNFGEDTLLGGAGDDVLNGGPGNDVFNSGPGADTINLAAFGGGGLDIVRGSAADFDGDIVNGIDFGDLLVLEGVSADAVTIETDGVLETVQIDGSGQSFPDSTFTYSPMVDPDDVQLIATEMSDGSATVLQLDPEAAPDAGIGQSITDPGDFDEIGNFLFGDDSIVPSEVSYTGAVESVALLSDGYGINEISGETPEQVVGIDRGVFLSSGGGPGTENTSGSYTEVLAEPGDPRLTETARDAYPNAGETNDASLITFTFDAEVLGDQPSVSFDLFFGSDEYPEYVDSSFVDIAAVYVNGVNYALFNNDPDQPLSITGDSINTPGNFYANDGDDGSDDDPFTGTFDTEYDGFSVLLNVLAPVQPGENTVTIGVADTGDSAYDSGLFVGNIQGSNVESGGSFVETSGSDGPDELVGNAAPQIFNLGGGEDTVTGAPDELDGDVIEGFGDDDLLTVKGSTFTIDDMTVTLGSAILDIDTDGDDEADTNITMTGDFSEATFDVESDGDDTNVTATGVKEQEEDGPIVGTAGNDELVGTAGDDEILGGDGNDLIFGEGGDDTLDGGAGDDNMGGGDGNDVLYGGEGDDSMGGGLGDDMMDGGPGDDFMGGGQGADTVMGGDGDDVVNGGAGDDHLMGGAGSDTMGGSFNDDLVEGGDGDDSMGGGAGQDTLEGGAGDDSIGGGEGDDVIDGGEGDDFLAGGGRDDVIMGGAGNDTINGGDGDDTMTGGEGADVFVYNFFKDGDADVITDFEDGVDSFLIKVVDPDGGTTNIDNGGNGLQGYLDALNISDTAEGAQMNIDGHLVLVEDVAAADLTVDDFQFI